MHTFQSKLAVVLYCTSLGIWGSSWAATPIDSSSQQSSTMTAPHQPSSTVKQPQLPQGNFKDQSLNPELTALIDKIKQLNETPGLIKSRADAHAFFGIKAVQYLDLDRAGLRTVGDVFAKEGLFGKEGWSSQLVFTEERPSYWFLQIEIGYGGKECIRSRDLETYWGKPFKFSPVGAHLQMWLDQRDPNLPAITAHDGIPNTPSFSPITSGAASVIFSIGRRACLSTIRLGRIYFHEEMSK